MDDRRTTDNPLSHLKAANTAVDVRRERRELNDEEIEGLLTAARSGRDVCGLTGFQRYTLYVTALGSGFRASELASLTPAHFDLDGTPPTLSIIAADEKARRGDTLPLSANVVKILRPFLEATAAGACLWPGSWAKHRRGGTMMKHDLGVAGTPYQTEDGQADFHALRHTFLSRLGRSGASPKVMMRLARHTSVQLTLGRYVHAGLYDLESAVNDMPDLPTGQGSAPESSVMRATGTDDIAMQEITSRPSDMSSAPSSGSRETDENVLPDGLPELVAFEGISLHLHAVEETPEEGVSGDDKECENALKTRVRTAFSRR